MPKKTQKETVGGALRVAPRASGRRVQADGRSNSPNAGRHSLGTKDHKEALRLVRVLDLTKAVDFSLADPTLLVQATALMLAIDDGRKRYLGHVSRPPVMGGASPKTVSRYNAVFDKFASFARDNNVLYWHQVTNAVVEKYGTWLDDRDYAGRTLYFELNTAKQAVKWMVAVKHLPATCVLTTRLSKVQASDTYCYSHEEVRAVVGACRSRVELQ